MNMALLGEKEPVDHGGSLETARTLFPGAPEPVIDLSTGINPHSYPLFDLPATALTRLPEPGTLRRLSAIAAETYGAPSHDHVVAAPGTQILLPLAMALVAPGRARVLGPTYKEHARAAALAGHEVREVETPAQFDGADVIVVVNPNNPDGRVMPRAHLLALAARQKARGGLLVVDEAFMDVGPRAESVAGDVAQGGLVVLRSFGKFFGLAGVRLGFALADPETAALLSARLGPWAVAGPALEYGARALSDGFWQAAMRARLAEDATRLDALLAAAGLQVAGGTTLFRFLRHADASALFAALGREGILVRRFSDRPDCLRLGLPGSEAEWQRLVAALAGWQRMGEVRA